MQNENPLVAIIYKQIFSVWKNKLHRNSKLSVYQSKWCIIPTEVQSYTNPNIKF